MFSFYFKNSSINCDIIYSVVKTYIKNKVFTYIWGAEVRNKGKILVINYYYKYKWYKIMYKPLKPSCIKFILDNFSKDINSNIIYSTKADKIVSTDYKKEEFEMFLGPNGDFHNQILTPLDLGYNDSISIIREDGEYNEYIEKCPATSNIKI